MAAKAAYKQVRAREHGRGERHERDKGQEPDDHDRDQREFRDDQEEEQGPVDGAAGDPFDSVAHAIARPAARELSVTSVHGRTVIFEAAGAATIDALR
jgi:hypothetical protein